MSATDQLREAAEQASEAAANFARIATEAPESFRRGAQRKSDFFRDIAGSRVMHIGEYRERGGPAADQPRDGPAGGHKFVAKLQDRLHLL